MKLKLTIILLPFLFITCKKEKENKEAKQAKMQVLPTIPSFNADSAYNFVATQVAFGPRVPSTTGHIKCGNYLIAMLKKYGCQVEVQAFGMTTFDDKSHQCRNIMGKINPSATKRILLASHWDSRPFADQELDKNDQKTPIDGANDGASGVGVLLEIARTLQNSSPKPTAGVDILFFDIEDYGQPEFSDKPERQNTWCLGAQYWAANKGNYTANFGVLLDMVGGKNAKFSNEGSSLYYASDIVQKVWNTAASAGFSHIFINQQVDQITDDHVFVNSIAKIPMVDIIEYDNSDGVFFANTWHTKSDNMQNIDKNSLKAVGQTLTHLIFIE